MPVHDWTRVSAGTFHDFHTVWMGAIRTALNDGVLPEDHYALCEQDATDVGPDVVTLRSTDSAAEAPPRVQFTATTEMDLYALKQRTLVIRHSSGDRIVALIEILSPGNKSSRQAFRAFLERAVAALAHGYHLLLIDLQPPSKRDPQGIHGALWSEISDDTYRAPPDKPLTLASYSAGLLKKAYVTPVAVGEPLPDMPLFLTPDEYVLVPLEATYLDAWRGVPKRWRRVLEQPTA
jgi:hypothetical protein